MFVFSFLLIAFLSKNVMSSKTVTFQPPWSWMGLSCKASSVISCYGTYPHSIFVSLDQKINKKRDEGEDLNVFNDYGGYVTQEFSYSNWQHFIYDDPWFVKEMPDAPHNLKWGPLRRPHPNHTAMIERRCASQYVKCITDMELPMAVCAYHTEQPPNVYIDFGADTTTTYYESYCHVYMENCLRYHRRWRFITLGQCVTKLEEEREILWPSGGLSNTNLW